MIFSKQLYVISVYELVPGSENDLPQIRRYCVAYFSCSLPAYGNTEGVVCCQGQISPVACLLCYGIRPDHGINYIGSIMTAGDWVTNALHIAIIVTVFGQRWAVDIG